MGNIKHTQFTPKALIVSDLTPYNNLNYITMNELNEIIENVFAMSEALDININPLNL
tara:strand:- start:1373 stop:1543 length:171 start_codon:yes stop_codon:yes gene_type:complete